MDSIDRKLAGLLREGVPIVEEPYEEMGKKLGINGDEVISRIAQLREEKILKRLYAWLAPRKTGSTENAMVVWNVPTERIEEVGTKIASFKEVTHCIQRPVVPGKWPYALYSMIHQSSREACEKLAKRISDAVGIKDYMLIYSLRGSHPR